MRDTIYRDDAIRVASGYCHPSNIAKELEKLPSAEKHGRWIDAQYPFSKCNQCGAYMDTVNNEANYCCVCGAKMEVEK